MELHVFDFDGTIFNSPAPREAEVVETHGVSVCNRLSAPLSSNGLGWFQSLSTLSPPAVPEKPDVDAWYVAPVLERIRAIHHLNAKHQPEAVDRRGGAGAEDRRALCFVLTGRDEKYRARVEALLDHAGLLSEFTQVFLKPHETAGTVKYKLNTIFQLVREHHPRRVFYYEDRPEQGGKLFAGVRLLQEAMYPSEVASGGEMSALRHLPPDARDIAEGRPPPAAADIAFTELFQGSGKREESAMQVARRWVAATVERLNERERTEGGAASGPSPHPQRRPRVDRADAALPPVTFVPPPRFHFTLFLIPDALVLRSERMLSAAAQRGVVEVLLREKAAYDANRDVHKAFRGPTPGRGRGGGGGGGSGCRGRGRGFSNNRHFFHHQHHQSHTNSALPSPKSRHVKEDRRWTPQSAYPELPPA